MNTECLICFKINQHILGVFGLIILKREVPWRIRKKGLLVPTEPGSILERRMFFSSVTVFRLTILSLK